MARAAFRPGDISLEQDFVPACQHSAVRIPVCSPQHVCAAGHDPELPVYSPAVRTAEALELHRRAAKERK